MNFRSFLENKCQNPKIAVLATWNNMIGCIAIRSQKVVLSAFDMPLFLRKVQTLRNNRYINPGPICRIECQDKFPTMFPHVREFSDVGTRFFHPIYTCIKTYLCFRIAIPTPTNPWSNVIKKRSTFSIQCISLVVSGFSSPIFSPHQQIMN